MAAHNPVSLLFPTGGFRCDKMVFFACISYLFRPDPISIAWRFLFLWFCYLIDPTLFGLRTPVLLESSLPMPLIIFLLSVWMLVAIFTCHFG